MKYIKKIKSRLIKIKLPDSLKTRFKNFKSLIVSGMTSLATLTYLYTPVLAEDGGVITGVEINGGKITIDVGEAGVSANNPTDLKGAFNKLFENGEIIIAGLTGILTLSMLGVFLLKAFQLAKSGDNPKARSKAINGMIFAAIGTALLGGATILMGFAYNLFI